MPIDNKQIYIVDDDESVCRALKLLLITFGFVVKTFSCSEKFFSAVPNSIEGLFDPGYSHAGTGWLGCPQADDQVRISAPGHHHYRG